MTEPVTFSPPSADQIKTYLAKHTQRQRPGLGSHLPMILLMMALGLTLTTDHVLMNLLPWILLLGVLLYMNHRVKSLRRLQDQVNRIQEMTMLRQVPQALRGSWSLIARTAQMPDLQGKLIAFMAHNLDHVRAYDAAATTYSFLIERMPPDHPLNLQLQLQRSIVQLLDDRLSDADNTLRKLRGRIADCNDTLLSATYHLAQLIQQVRTHHFQDAVEQADTLEDRLRPLGIDAGYGHGLMALCFFQLAQRDQPDQFVCAKQWWRQAVYLLSPARLTYRFTELSAVATWMSRLDAEMDFQP